MHLSGNSLRPTVSQGNHVAPLHNRSSVQPVAKTSEAQPTTQVQKTQQTATPSRQIIELSTDVQAVVQKTSSPRSKLKASMLHAKSLLQELMRPHIQRSVMSIGSDPAVLGSAKSLVGKFRYSAFNPEKPPGAKDKLTIVGHGSADGKTFGGMNPRQLVEHLRSQGVTSLNHLSLKGCQSAQFARELFAAMEDMQFPIESITGRTGAVVISKDGSSLVEQGGELLHQAEGTKIRVTKANHKGEDVYEAFKPSDVRAESQTLLATGHSGKLLSAFTHANQATIDAGLLATATDKEIDDAVTLAKDWLNTAFIAKNGAGKTELISEIETFRTSKGGGPWTDEERTQVSGTRSGIETSIHEILAQLDKPGITNDEKQRTLKALNEIHQAAVDFSGKLSPGPARFATIGHMQTALRGLKDKFKDAVDKAAPKQAGKVSITFDATHGFRFAGRTGISFFGNAAKMQSSQPDGYQLRHITSWNNMRDSMEILLNHHNKLGTLAALESQFDVLLAKAKSDAPGKGRWDRAASQIAAMPDLGPHKNLCIKAYAILDLAHSCQDNLWSGDGPENMLFGQFKHAVSVKCDKVAQAGDKATAFAAFKQDTQDNIAAIRNDSLDVPPVHGLDRNLQSFLTLLDASKDTTPDIRKIYDELRDTYPAPLNLQKTEQLYSDPKTTELLVLLQKNLGDPDKAKLLDLCDKIDIGFSTLKREDLIKNILDGVPIPLDAHGAQLAPTDANITRAMAFIKESLSFHDVDIQIFNEVDDIVSHIAHLETSADLTTQKDALLGFMAEHNNLYVDAVKFNDILQKLNGVAGPKRATEAKKMIAELIMNEYSPTVEAGRVLDEIRLLSSEPLDSVKGFLTQTIQDINTDLNLGQFKKDSNGKLNEEQVLLAVQTMLKVASQEAPAPALVRSFSQAINDRLPTPVSAELTDTLAKLAATGAYNPLATGKLSRQLTQLNQQLGQLQATHGQHNLTKTQAETAKQQAETTRDGLKYRIYRHDREGNDKIDPAISLHNAQVTARRQLLTQPQLDAQLNLLEQQIAQADATILQETQALTALNPQMVGCQQAIQLCTAQIQAFEQSQVPIVTVQQNVVPDMAALLKETQSQLITKQFDVLLSSY